MAAGSDELLQAVPRIGARRPRVFVWAAAAALLVVLAGFAKSYYLRGFFETGSLTTLVHMHGVVMTLWFATLLAQALLISAGNVRVHRQVGAAGAGLAALVLIVGTATAIAAARNGVSPGPPPLVFLAIPLGDMVVFAILVGLGFAYRRRGDYHKRFMISASLGILTAAIARLPLSGGLPLFFGLTDLVFIAFVAVDSITNRRLHPAFAIGFGVVLVSQVGRFLIAGTPQWMQFARWLTS